MNWLLVSKVMQNLESSVSLIPCTNPDFVGRPGQGRFTITWLDRKLLKQFVALVAQYQRAEAER